jgi:hypothetical protein
MGVSAFGTGTPMTYPTQFGPWGASQYGFQGVAGNPYAWPQQAYSQPFINSPINPANIASLYGGQPLQQLFQLLQVVPQQLQQLQQSTYIQQHQLQQVLQSLVQLAALQTQQPSQFQQALGQAPGVSGFGAASPWGAGSQGLSSQPGHVM